MGHDYYLDTDESLSSLFLRPMLMAVCLTMEPSVRLLTTIPSTSGIAMEILIMINKQLNKNSKSIHSSVLNIGANIVS